MIGEVAYRLVACTFAIQIRATFAKHFSLHQFSVTTQGGCEMVVYEVHVMLHLHSNWVVLQMDIYNAFNFVS